MVVSAQSLFSGAEDVIVNSNDNINTNGLLLIMSEVLHADECNLPHTFGIMYIILRDQPLISPGFET